MEVIWGGELFASIKIKTSWEEWLIKKKKKKTFNWLKEMVEGLQMFIIFFSNFGDKP